jgi:hypothetical protein
VLANAKSLVAALSVLLMGAPPNSCKFVSVAEVTELIGKTVGGGQQSFVDNPKSLTSSCAYTLANRPTVLVSVADYPSAAEAKQEFTRQLQNSSDNKTETGIGDGAFWTTVVAQSITAVHGQRLATIAFLGDTPAVHERMHALMVKALSR